MVSGGAWAVYRLMQDTPVWEKCNITVWQHNGMYPRNILPQPIFWLVGGLGNRAIICWRTGSDCSPAQVCRFGGYLSKYIHFNHFTSGSIQISFALPLFIIADERQRKKISVGKNHSRLLQLNALKRFQVLTSACAVISVVACDWENLGVITDYEVVPHLAKLTYKVSF